MVKGRIVKGGLAALALALSLAPAAAVAQEAEAEQTKSDGKVRVELRGGKKVFRIETSFVIEGRIQKPNAFYVLQRSAINYDWVKLKQDFVPRIVESVRQSPF